MLNRIKGSHPFHSAMAAMRSMRNGSVTGTAPEHTITICSMLATAGRLNWFFRGRTASTIPFPSWVRVIST